MKKWEANIVTAENGTEKWAVTRNNDSASEPVRLEVKGEAPQAGRMARKVAKMLNAPKPPRFTHGT